MAAAGRGTDAGERMPKPNARRALEQPAAAPYVGGDGTRVWRAAPECLAVLLPGEATPTLVTVTPDELRCACKLARGGAGACPHLRAAMEATASAEVLGGTTV